MFFPMPIGAMASGAIFGLIGALGAVGIGLIWRANRIVNFAQGDLGVFPATLAVLLVLLAGWPWLPSVSIGILCALAVGRARRPARHPEVLPRLAAHADGRHVRPVADPGVRGPDPSEGVGRGSRDPHDRGPVRVQRSPSAG